MTTQEVDGKTIIVITVAKAAPEDSPVFTCGNREQGVYIRCGEGNFRRTDLS